MTRQEILAKFDIMEDHLNNLITNYGKNTKPVTFIEKFFYNHKHLTHFLAHFLLPKGKDKTSKIRLWLWDCYGGNFPSQSKHLNYTFTIPEKYFKVK